MNENKDNIFDDLFNKKKQDEEKINQKEIETKKSHYFEPIKTDENNKKNQEFNEFEGLEDIVI